MNTTNNIKALKSPYLVENVWEASMAYIKTIVDIEREPFLILDDKLCVIVANEIYYNTFKLLKKNVEGKSVFKLGKEEWNVSTLRNKLENVVANETFFKGFEMTCDFKGLGRRTMVLNARMIYMGVLPPSAKSVPDMVLFAMDDITEMISVADELSLHVSTFEADIANRTARIETGLADLKKRIL